MCCPTQCSCSGSTAVRSDPAAGARAAPAVRFVIDQDESQLAHWQCDAFVTRLTIQRCRHAVAGSGAKSHRRTSSGKRPTMRRMYTDEDPLAEKLSAEDQALLVHQINLPPATLQLLHCQPGACSIPKCHRQVPVHRRQMCQQSGGRLQRFTCSSGMKVLTMTNAHHASLSNNTRCQVTLKVTRIKDGSSVQILVPPQTRHLPAH
jgi:hypothetical protein